MIKSLLGFFSKQSDAPTLGKNPRSIPRRVAADFRAVCIDSSSKRCAAAKHAAEVRYLMREAPRLPLADCTMIEGCKCGFRKMPDRRVSERRMRSGGDAHLWHQGSESRIGGSRRHSEA